MRTAKLVVMGVCWVLVVFAFGCKQADDPCVPARCDVRERACQLQVARAVQCMRGGDTVMPEVAVITAAELEAMVVEEEPTEEEQLAFERVMRGYALFSLADPDATIEDVQSDATSEIAAVYVRESKRILIVDRGHSMDSAQAVATLAHEMVHAMQDVEHDLQSVTGATESTDEWLAAKALIEGEATHYEVLTYAALESVDAEDIDWDELYETLQADQLQAAAADASPIVMAQVRFPYAFGGQYVTRIIVQEPRGQEQLARLFATPPKSTREILLHVFAHTYDELEMEGIPVVPDFELIDHDRLGAWLLYSAQVHAGILDEYSGAAPRGVAEGSGGDVVSIFHAAEGDRLIAAWRQRRAELPHRGGNDVWTTLWSSALASTPSVVQSLAWADEADLMMLASDAPGINPAFATDVAWTMVPEDEDEPDTMTAAAAIDRALRWSGCRHATARADVMGALRHAHVAAVR